MNKVYESAGHLQNGIEVYSSGIVFQGSERAAYENGGSSFSEWNRSESNIPRGCSQVFDTTPSFNSMAEFCGVKVTHHSNGEIEVSEIDADEYEMALVEEPINDPATQADQQMEMSMQG